MDTVLSVVHLKSSAMDVDINRCKKRKLDALSEMFVSDSGKLFVYVFVLI